LIDITADYDVVNAAQRNIDRSTIYQTAVILLTDKYVAESPKSIDISKLRSHDIVIDRGKIETHDGHQGDPQPFERYADTEDGISKRILPGSKGRYYQANSYEHVADGHTTEDAKDRIIQVDKRNRKLNTYISRHFVEPTLYGPKEAEITLIGWGGVKGPILEAMKEVGDKINYLHFTHMWPMDQQKITDILKRFKHLVLVENNSTAQFAQLIRQETGVVMHQKMLKYDGRPFYPEEIVAYVKTHL